MLRVHMLTRFGNVPLLFVGIGLLLCAVGCTTPPRGSDVNLASNKTILTLVRRTELVCCGYAEPFAWSPDAKQLLLVDGLDIFFYDVQTGTKGHKLFGPRVETTEGYISGIAWGASRIVAFSGGLEEQHHILFLNEDGSQAYPSIEGFDPVWIGNQHRMLYQRGSPLYWMISEIWLLDLDTGSQQKLCEGIRAAVIDKTRFVYRKLDPVPQRGLWLFHLDTKQQVQLTNNDTDEPSTTVWNRHVIFTRRQEQTELWMLDVDTGEEAKLLGEECLYPTVSSSGQGLLCWTRTREEDKYALTLFELQRREQSQ